MDDTAFLAAAQALADLRYRYAETFLMHRMNQSTDYKARALADLECIKELTMAEAHYELEKARLRGGTSHPAEPEGT